MSDVNKSCAAKPEIQYPCRWQYRLIGEDREAILAAISAAVGINGMDLCTIVEGSVSTGGRYRTITLELDIKDEEERLRLYHFFSDHAAIRVVL